MARLCLIPSTFDAAGWYRLLWPGGYLQSSGWEALVPPQQPARLPSGEMANVFQDIDRNLPGLDADVYVFQQPQDRDMVSIAKYLQVVGKKVVVETDDDFRCIPDYHPSRGAWEQRERPLRRGFFQLERMVELADKLVVSTRSIADSYREHNPAVIGNLLHWPMWEPVRPVYESGFRRTRVGWMGGLEWRKADLDLLKGWLPEWLVKHPHVEFVAAGDQRVHDYLGIPGAQRVSAARIPFRNMDLPYITATMDVVLVPLADNKFNEGKSALRGMECGAVGVPCIATPTVEYKSWVEPFENGFLASSVAEWVKALEMMVGYPDERRRMGENARRKARDWSLDRRGAVWGDFYRHVIGDDHHPDTARTGDAAGGVQGVGGGADGAGDAPGDGGRRRLWATEDPEPVGSAGDDGMVAAAR